MKSLIILAVLPFTLPVFAGTLETESQAMDAPADPCPWWLTIAPYGWVTATEGDMGAAGRVAPVDISFKDTLEELEIAAMLAVEAGFERWVFGMDMVYGASGSSVGLTPSATSPFTVVNVDIEQLFGRAHVGYRVLETEDMTLTALAGFRYSYFSTDIALEAPGGPRVTAEGSEDWLDPILGMRGSMNLCEKTVVSAGGDIGGFGVNSDLIWQANLLFGYRITESISSVIGYRAMGVDYSDGGFLVDTVSHGPVIGMTFQF